MFVQLLGSAIVRGGSFYRGGREAGRATETSSRLLLAVKHLLEVTREIEEPGSFASAQNASGKVSAVVVAIAAGGSEA